MNQFDEVADEAHDQESDSLKENLTIAYFRVLLPVAKAIFWNSFLSGFVDLRTNLGLN